MVKNTPEKQEVNSGLLQQKVPSIYLAIHPIRNLRIWKCFTLYKYHRSHGIYFRCCGSSIEVYWIILHIEKMILKGYPVH